MFTRVADDKDNASRLVRVFCDLQCGRKIRACRAAAKYAFTARQLPREIERFAVGDVDYLVDPAHIRVADGQGLADAFDKIRRGFWNAARLFVGLEDRSVRVGADDLDLRVLLF